MVITGRPWAAGMNDDQLLRYSRHILLPQVDVSGQERFLAARVLIIGLGGLGSPAALYLCAAGVGELVLVDDDLVDASNLQRQVVHRESTIGLAKVDSAASQLRDINSECKLSLIQHRLDEEQLTTEVAAADIVLDCCDNFGTRQLVNRVCRRAQTPLVSGAAVRMEGQLVVFDFRDPAVACYECLYQLTGDEDLSCAQNGVLSPVVGIIGCHQALEALRLLAGIGPVISGRLGLFDGGRNEWRYLNLRKDPECPCCGSRK